MASTPGLPLDPEPCVRLVRTSGMLNRTLQSICIREGLKQNGVKAELQQRIIERTCDGERNFGFSLVPAIVTSF
jgi:hypothetical protein